jgi:hypothetical protein
VEDFIKTMSPSKNGLECNISSSFVRGAYLVRKQKMDTLMVVDRKTDELDTVFGNEGWATAINKVGYEFNRNDNIGSCGFDVCVDMDLFVVVQVEKKNDVRPTVTRVKSTKRPKKKKKEEVPMTKIVTVQMLGAIMEQKDGEYAATSATSVGSVGVNLATFFVSAYQPITETASASSKSEEESNNVQNHQTFEPSLARFRHKLMRAITLDQHMIKVFGVERKPTILGKHSQLFYIDRQQGKKGVKINTNSELKDALSKESQKQQKENRHIMSFTIRL